MAEAPPPPPPAPEAPALGLLTHLAIKGFKSIRDAKIDLARLNVLIGPNGSGKSNFIGVFKLLRSIVDHRLRQHVAEGGSVGRFLHFGPKTTPRLRIILEFIGGSFSYEALLAPTDDHLLFLAHESYECPEELGYKPQDGATATRKELGSGVFESKLHQEPGNKDFPGTFAIKQLLLACRTYHFHDTSRSSEVKQPARVQDNRSFREDAGNLPAFLHKIQLTDAHSYRTIVQAVRQVAPFFDDFVLAPDEINTGIIRLQWKHRTNDDYFDVASLSDGTLRFICLATLLLQPKPPSVIIIDEPELGLHPSAIVLLAELLRSASQKSQIIVSTQSTTLVNQFQPEDVIVVESHEGASSFRRLTSEGLADWLGDYGLGDLWEKNLIGGRP